jgi:hypothetical protein
VEFCVLAHQMNHENTKSMVAALSEKAARLKQ